LTYTGIVCCVAVLSLHTCVVIYSMFCSTTSICVGACLVTSKVPS